MSAADHLLQAAVHPNRARAFILHNKAVALIRMGRSDEAYGLARQAFLVSRISAWLTIPLLFFMGAASHYPFLGR